MWWLKRLDERRINRLNRYKQLRNYANGDHPLPDGSDAWKDHYKKWQRRARTNYCGLAARSVSERMTIDGFRAGDKDTEDKITAIWQRNLLDSDSRLVHSCQTDLSDAYVIVGPDDKGGALVTPESPEQVITETDPGNRRVTRAGLKVWKDDDTRHAELYLPDSITRFRSASEYEDWRRIGQPEGNPLGQVPVVRFVNRPLLGGDGLAEFEDAIDPQDRINTIILQILSISASQAFRQRWVKGLDLTDAEGNDIEPPFEAVVSALWAVEDTNIEFGEFAQVDLRPLLDSLKAAIEAFITLTGLPPHYVAGDLVNASADSLAAAEARLVAKVKDRTLVAGQAWETVVMLAGKLEGFEVPDTVEVIWKDPERRTDAQLADAALKGSQFGVPWRQRMEDRGYSIATIDRMLGMRDEDAVYVAASQALAAQASLEGLDNGEV
tara:strand:+ start:2518 stop:3831 length:1314 start_codon:yes stop_codon:yes gene_type:complete